MPLRDRVKRAYQLKQGQQVIQTQPQPQADLNEILWIKEQLETARPHARPRPRATKNVLELLRRVRKY